ncbi:mucin-2-like [Anguilla rostrata]|uniref:mucin-2-like n=1 Tax=Anguilla rostrata TaxID=7938 RepID=UPI0030D5161E
MDTAIQGLDPASTAANTSSTSEAPSTGSPLPAATTTLPTPVHILEATLPVPFVPALENSQSTEYQDLAKTVIGFCDIIFYRRYGLLFERTEVRSFSRREEGTAVEVALIFNGTSSETLPSTDDVAETLIRAVTDPDSTLTTQFNVTVVVDSIRVLTTTTLPTPVLNLQATLEIPFVPELENSQSTEYQVLATAVVGFYDVIFRIRYGILFERTEVRSFSRREEGTAVEVALIFNRTSSETLPSTDNVAETLIRAVTDPDSTLTTRFNVTLIVDSIRVLTPTSTTPEVPATGSPLPAATTIAPVIATPTAFTSIATSGVSNSAGSATTIPDSISVINPTKSTTSEAPSNGSTVPAANTIAPVIATPTAFTSIATGGISNSAGNATTIADSISVINPTTSTTSEAPSNGSTVPAANTIAPVIATPTAFTSIATGGISNSAGNATTIADSISVINPTKSTTSEAPSNGSTVPAANTIAPVIATPTAFTSIATGGISNSAGNATTIADSISVINPTTSTTSDAPATGSTVPAANTIAPVIATPTAFTSIATGGISNSAGNATTIADSISVINPTTSTTSKAPATGSTVPAATTTTTRTRTTTHFTTTKTSRGSNSAVNTTTITATNRPAPISVLVLEVTLVFPFEPALEDNQSPQFKALSAQIVALCDAVYRGRYGLFFIRTVVRAFRPLRVRMLGTDVEADLIFNTTMSEALPSTEDVKKTLQSAVTNPNSTITSEFNITVVAESIRVMSVNTSTTPSTKLTTASVANASTTTKVKLTTAKATTRATTTPSSAKPATAAPTSASTATPSAIVQIEFTSRETFVPDLLNQNSKAFQARSKLTKEQIEPIFRRAFSSFIQLNIRSFREGSIVTNADMTFKSSESLPSNDQILSTLRNAILNSQISFDIDPDSIKLTSAIPSGVSDMTSVLTASSLAMVSLLLSHCW